MEQKVKPRADRAAAAGAHAGAQGRLRSDEKNLGFVRTACSSCSEAEDRARLRAAQRVDLGAGGEVDRGFKRLIAHVASRAAGCQYCMAHTAGGALHFGIDEQRLAAVWEFRTSALFTEGEKIALDFALAAASSHGVTDEMFTAMRKHWSESQIVEIVAVIATFGFLNRWNDTMGTRWKTSPSPSASGSSLSTAGARGSTRAAASLLDRSPAVCPS